MTSFTASPVQSQFYLASQLHPTPALNTMTFAVRIQGRLIPERLGRAIHLISTHQVVLRSWLRANDGAVLQLVDDNGAQTFLDVQQAPDTYRAIADAADLLRESLSPESPTWKALLLVHREEDYSFIFAAHRVIWDERSTEIFVAELSALYAADAEPNVVESSTTDAGQSEPDSRPELAEERIALGARYFASTLNDVPALHGFPTTHTRARTLLVDADSFETEFGNSLLELLSLQARQWDLDPFVILATAATYVLAQFSSQQKLAIGLPFDLRRDSVDRAVLGSYTSMLPLGVDCAASSFDALVHGFAEQYSSASGFAHTPFHMIVKECGARIHPAANALFQIACVKDQPLVLSLKDCDCSPCQLPVPPQQVDLFLRFSSTSMRVDYAKQIIATEMVSAFGRSLCVFLEAALREPNRALSSVPLLSESASNPFTLDHNQTEESSFLGQDLYSILTRHCKTSSEKAALIFNGIALSYGSLLSAVETLSSRLSASGLAAESLLGICLPRSTDMVVAMLAVLRSGAAYVPLDPAFPQERLMYMVEHSKLTAIITTSKLRSLYEHGSTRFIELDQEYRSPSDTVVSPVQVPRTTRAYVIYTSGSTGRPKGVAISRGAAANFLLSMLDRPGVGSTDTLCAVTTLSFDIAVLELLAPLCAGGTVVVAAEDEARDPRLLMSLLDAHQVTMLQATPVTWQMLCAANWSGHGSLKALCGGEALPSALAQNLKPRVRELWNMYGPTETTVWSACGRIDDPDLPISVGTPIHNTHLYVVDDGLRALPVGVEGRLFIGGEGVALGYLFDEDLTAKRFIPDTFRGMGLMYDTGDRARLEPNGELHIVGRSDFQVKIRGFRIELEEIESRLSSLPAIAQVVCAVRRDDPASPELVAYFALHSDFSEPSVTELRNHCGQVLPTHMVPSRFIRLTELPRTPNGKIDRNSLPKPTGDQVATDIKTEHPVARSKIESSLLDIWCRVLSVKAPSINDSFFDLGGTSIAAFTVAQEIARQLAIEISVLKIFEFPTIATLAQFLKGSQASSSFIQDAYRRAQARRKFADSSTAFDVAIIGAAGRFPGARNLDQLWQNLEEGRETVTTFSRDELDQLVSIHDRNDPSYSPSRGVLEDIELFDAAFFGIGPNEAELMDPQLRIFMEVAWEAFEHSGYVGEHINGDVGVWAGMGNNFYYHYNVLTRPDKLAIVGEIAAEIANEKDHIAPRVSHKLNLTGPSLSVHTACSTTLVVVENAYQALVSHQVDVALAGGIDIRTPQKSGQRHEVGGVFSLDGHCRPFDAAADGTMFGEGVGAVVLKRLDDALRDGDTIHAVIKGAAVNHDGGHKVSYLAPSVEGQAKVIASALGLGDVNPDTISFVEAHGTATPIGDPIEVEALTRVYRAFTQRRRYCAIGSVKGNFGHATTAAGIAGILKVLMAMRHKKIPATLHYKIPNPRIDFASSPFFVNNQLIDWQPKGIARRASVSSFGFCGTNAHVILEEAPDAKPSSPPDRPAQLVLLSARKAKALDEVAERLASTLNGANASQLADAAYTTHVGRKRFEHRRCVVIENADEASTLLAQAGGSRSASLKSEVVGPSVAFIFPGQGSQYVNMGLRLYQGEDQYRDAVDRCATGLLPHLGCDLRKFLFPNPGDNETARQALNNTFYTQPAIFTVSYAIAAQFTHWGIQPSVFLGHSIGEFVAATLSGVMELDEALRLVATRGRLMQGLPSGSMLSVRLPVEKVIAQLPFGIDVAAVNGPELTVVAGPTQLLSTLSENLSATGVVCRMLHTSHAFHSSMMDEVVEPFLRVVESVRLSAPQVPIVSTVTGDWMKSSDAMDPSYWARHLRSPVQYSKAAQVLLADDTQALLECGPRRTCSTLALQHRPKNSGRVIAAMPDSAEPDDEYPNLLLALGSLWLNGCNPDWSTFHQRETRRRIALPAYPFQRQRYWIEPGNLSSFGLDGIEAPKANPVVSDATKESSLDGDNTEAAGDHLMSSVVAILEQVLGGKIESFDEDARFVALGLDSLLVTQLARIMRLRFGLDVTFRDLTERYSTTRLLTDAIRVYKATTQDQNRDDVANCSVQVGDSQPPMTNGPAATATAPNDCSPLTLEEVSPMDCRIGRDEGGQPAWYVSNAVAPGRYLQVTANDALTSSGKCQRLSLVCYDPFSVNTSTELATTPSQLEMWLSAQLGSDASCAYNESFSVHLKGAVQEDALIRALQSLPEFHEALRGHFSADGERFVIARSIAVEVAVRDLSTLPSSERATEWQRLAMVDSGTSFSLERGPLFRAALIRLDAQEYVVLMSAHHAACDGWSLDVLLADLGRLYSGFVGHLPLPAAPAHGFSDYVTYSQSRNYSQHIESAREFWRKTFKDLPPVLSLPYEGQRPAVRTYGAFHAQHVVEPDTHDAVRVFSRTHGISVFSVLLSAVAALFQRISNESDLVIGIPVAGHPEAGMEDCVGHLVNLVPVRCRVDSTWSFLELCHHTNSAILDARENATVGFGEIVADLQVPRDSSRVPLIQAALTHVRKYAPGKLVFGECAIDYSLNPRSFETFEFGLNIIESQERLEIRGHANSDLFGRDWLNLRLCELECLLRNACTSFDTTIGELMFLPDAEQHRLLFELNDTAVDVQDTVIHRLFEQVVDSGPTRPAVSFEDQTVTFEQLDRKANRIAHALVARGVGPNTLVGVCLPRGIALVATLLGVLKAGGGYLPLDPSYPQERIEYFVTDSGAKVVVTDAERSELFHFDAEQLLLDRDAQQLQSLSDSRVQREDSSSQLAYVIYTSGSTGKPKGVMVEHRNVINFFAGMRQALGLDSSGVFLAGASVSFDISVLELFGTLCHGRHLVVVGDTVLGQVQRSGFELHALAERYGVTHFQRTISQSSILLLDSENRRMLGRLRQLLVGGETLHQDLGDELSTLVSGEVINGYGPTETTVVSTTARVNKGERITIGRPLANTCVLILDTAGALVPYGAVGELCIGGLGVTRGYLNRPKLTAERYIENRYRPDLGTRLYRTGDLVRFDPQGNLLYLGRNDHQVKIRGHRVELGELESVLVAHPNVRQTTILAREFDSGDVRLVAYVVPTEGLSDAQQLRAYLKRTLPDYMIPQHFVFMDSIPVTPNGKIDRERLPQPEAPVPTATQPAAARSETENTVYAIWARNLGYADFAIDGNFFDIGGSSLIAVRVVRELERTLGIEIGLTALYQYPTVADLARYVSGHEESMLASTAGKLAERAHKQRQALTRVRRRPND